jgi:hypothetical protein
VKGFIEVHESGDRQCRVTINANKIEMFFNKHICVQGRTLSVEETYSQIKALIEAAQREDNS